MTTLTCKILQKVFTQLISVYLLPCLLPKETHTLSPQKHAWTKCRLLIFNIIQTQDIIIYMRSLISITLNVIVQPEDIICIMKTQKEKVNVLCGWISLAKHIRWLQRHFTSPWKFFIQCFTKRSQLFNPLAVTVPLRGLCFPEKLLHPKAQVVWTPRKGDTEDRCLCCIRQIC